MSQDRVMLLIDADNVSVDVMEQAVRLLLNQHGGLHVRRAYCTAESAVSNQAAFKRLGIKPMVNLAAGKNSTDIALAVDAIDLVLAERPDVVVIASSDSDFAPLVHRLREKGCVVRGIGQKGKTGDETQEVYDDFTVLEHHRAAATEAAAGKPARKTTRKAAVRAPATEKLVPAKKVPAAKKVASRAAAKVSPPQAAVAEDSAAIPSKTPAAKAAPRKTPARKLAAVVPAPARSPRAAKPSVTPAAAAAPASASIPASAPAPAPTPAPIPPNRPASRDSRGSRSGASAGSTGTSVQAVLACLPELTAGKNLALNVAVQRLRESQLLGKNSSSLKLFAQLGEPFELFPADKPTQVRLRR